MFRNSRRDAFEILGGAGRFKRRRRRRRRRRRSRFGI